MHDEQLENGNEFTPRFAANGLIPVIAQDYATKEILMLAYMNHEALEKTIATKKAYYYSRSRQSLWLKGETSGQIQTVHKLRIDCDQDTIILEVSVGGDGGCCHVGYQNCFYRELGEDGKLITVGSKVS